jgi:DNA-binding CsgD family transcriptional regulator
MPDAQPERFAAHGGSTVRSEARPIGWYVSVYSDGSRPQTAMVMTGSADLERGRKAYSMESWLSAFDSLAIADSRTPLAAADLELLATSAYMLGRDDEYVAALERAHHGHLDGTNVPRAVRCAFWIGHSFLFRGQPARATGWFARGQRLLDSFDGECVERGYLMIPVWLEQMGRGNFEEGYATAMRAAETGERFRDGDLVWLARDDQARALMRLGRVKEGLRLVDEALAAAAAGDLSPIVTGIVYCNTIAFCRAAHDVRHVREWTRALTAWCARQPDMIAHNGLCLVHRAEIMLLGGEWEMALSDARRSADRFTRGALNQLARGGAFYCQGEAHRLRGDFEAAETAYREASVYGHEPQPGLALMRLAQGKPEAAAAAIRRIAGETTVPLRRAGILPAYVEIMVAIGSLDLARAACRELDETSKFLDCEALAAMAAQSRGAVALAEGRASDALIELRGALAVWRSLDAPYEAARVRTLIGLACRVMADHDSAILELDAARGAFRALGAVPDESRVAALLDARSETDTHGLTGRELQVLRLVASGKSNRGIAEELFISEHTVARHVQNIFAKLAVSSRAAATAFAFSHQLV